MARDAPTYLPDMADLYYRGNAVQWFTARKWDVRVVNQIMYHDNPSIDTVERLVQVYGEEHAYQLIQRVNSD